RVPARRARRAFQAAGAPSMNRHLLILSCALAALSVPACERPRPQPEASAAEVSPPELAMIGAHLLEGLGDYRFPVTSAHPEVQRWFDQGLMLAYGFNHDAAERSFLRAT